jgi:transposase
VADERYPTAKKITLVMDNFKTHTIGAFYETFEAVEAKGLVDRFEFVFTPKHGNWLNMVEIELHVLNAQRLNRQILTIEKMKKAVDAWQKHRNKMDAKINWQFTTKEARIKLKKLYTSFDN